MAKKTKRRVTRLVVPRGVAATPTPRAPDRWNLAAKEEIAPTCVVRDPNDLIGQFFLGLSVAFNDLKGLVMFEQYLIAMGRPPVADFSPYFGQWHGVKVQIERYIAGVLHEIMNVIAARRFRGVRAGNELRTLVDGLAPENRQAWDGLVAVATGPQNGGNMSSLLQRIRNGTSFHYGHTGTELGDRYREFYGRLATANPAENNRSAQFSLGRDMDGTRFFYADAAAQRVVAAQLEGGNATVEDVYALAGEVNLALASLIGAFLRARAAT